MVDEGWGTVDGGWWMGDGGRGLLGLVMVMGLEGPKRVENFVGQRVSMQAASAAVSLGKPPDIPILFPCFHPLFSRVYPFPLLNFPLSPIFCVFFSFFFFVPVS